MHAGLPRTYTQTRTHARARRRRRAHAHTRITHSREHTLPAYTPVRTHTRTHLQGGELRNVNNMPDSTYLPQGPRHDLAAHLGERVAADARQQAEDAVQAAVLARLRRTAQRTKATS